ncbi:MAG: DUF169 domain-containing protein [Desulfosalsimonadaceae bacterium]|nr:DUF169 domain-containing protein [Desulfosalsimonadaceae bacterium]
MQSKIASATGILHEPVAILFSNDKPQNARQFQEGKWGCVMFMLGAAVNGDIAVFDRKTFGCQGGGVGLGFGNQYQNFPGGEDCFCHFLSTGNDAWERGRQAAESVKPYLRPEAFDHFLHGERYVKSPELVKKFIESLPIVDIPYEYVIFKPLKLVDPALEKPEVIVFLGDMNQIAALTILANYHRGTNDNVIYPWAAGCQSIGIYAFREAASETPRAVLGLNDISARLTLKRVLKEQVMSFAAPYPLFLEMETNVEHSFLERPTWKALIGNK